MSDEKDAALQKATEADQKLRAAEDLQTMQERLQSNLAKLRIAENQVREYQKIQGKWREEIDGIVDGMRAVMPYPRVKYAAGTSCSSPVGKVLQFGDWQIGEVVLAEAMEGFNEFNWEIAQRRVFKAVECVIESTRLERHNFTVDELNVQALADFVSGGIHYELDVTDEWPVPVQAINAGWLLAEAIARLSPHFKRIQVDAVTVDNHGRRTKKYQHKQAALNNWNYVVYAAAREALRKHDNVEWNIFKGEKEVIQFANHAWLLEHGHTLKSQLGFPWYDTGRRHGREAAHRMTHGNPYHYWSIGHFHTAGVIPMPSLLLLANGSLPGSAEFGASMGLYGPPAQCSMLVHPKHGMFNWTTWKLAEKKGIVNAE